MTKERIGKFRISEDTLRHRWAELLPLMGNFVIVHADHDWSTREVVYTAYSALFDEVEPLYSLPWYDFTISENTVPATMTARRFATQQDYENAKLNKPAIRQPDGSWRVPLI